MVLRCEVLSFGVSDHLQAGQPELQPRVPSCEKSMKKTKGDIRRMIRGGSENTPAKYCCSVWQGDYRSRCRYIDIGFRLVRKG